MTIGELEAALDMPRANIRFYEQEGFIHPRRGANNYRDYTEEDADTLRKVKLLRQLGLSLEEIRQAQRGERPLAALLGEQEAALARRRAELDWAGQVCRAMREDGVEFATLDAHRYLSRLDRPADQPGFFDLRADAAPTVSHPWRRYFARGLDYSLCSFLWMVVCLFLFRWFPENNWGVRLLNAYAAYGILLAAEPLLLCTWGYTPGKWIFGLAVRNRDGGKLTWGRALSRTWGVFARGEGYGIPIYVLWRNYKCWRRCRDGEPEDWEEDTSYTMKDESGLRIGGFAAARAALFGLSLLLALQATLMPLHRGPLTPEEYAANVNDWCRRLDVCSGERMNGAGEWEEDTAPGRSAVCWPGEGGPTHRLTVNGAGEVTGVRIEVERTGEEVLFGSTTQQSLAAAAFAAAQPGWNGVSWWSSGVLQAVRSRPFDSYTLQAGAVTVTQMVSWEGYQDVGGWLLAEDGVPEEELYCRTEFTMTLQT